MARALPSLRQLRYLTALAEHLHFGKAAEACLATQSTLSAGLAELEAVLGATLVERTRRRVILTPLGRDIVERAAQVLRLTEDLVDVAQAARAEPLSGTLLLGIIPTIAPFLLPRLFADLRRDLPKLRLLLREDLTANLLERLDKGALDLALLALPYNLGGYEVVELAQDPFVLACPPGNALAGLSQVGPMDLSRSDMILLEAGHCLRDHALAACPMATVGDGQAVIEATSLATLVQMVASGIGVTLLPKLAVDGGVLAGTALVTRPLAPPGGSRGLALVWRAASPRAAEYRLLAGRCRQTVSSLLPVFTGA